jgi:hypothetical protein
MIFMYALYLQVLNSYRNQSRGIEMSSTTDYKKIQWSSGFNLLPKSKNFPCIYIKVIGV